MKGITLILGPTCSGKDYLAKQMLHERQATNHIDIGQIVREISQTTARIHNTSFDKLIISQLRSYLLNISSATEDYHVVITGIRQKTIVDWIFDVHGLSGVSIVWLDVLESELKRRFESRDNKKEQLTFEEVLKRDATLGLEEVEQYVKDLSLTKIRRYASNTL